MMLLAAVMIHKLELAVEVRYSPACPGSHSSFLVVNQSKRVRPPVHGALYLRLRPGRHLLTVLHPWCTWGEAQVDVFSDGGWEADVNGTVIVEGPIKLRPFASDEETTMWELARSPVAWLMGAGVLVMIVLRCTGLGGRIQGYMQNKVAEAQAAQAQAQGAKAEGQGGSPK